jgi:predicted nuclease of predicted toxin-antitoxin system
VRFLVDANLSPRVAEWLRCRGHDAAHVFERGLAQARDGAIFERAAAERRILLTADLDFGQILARSRGSVSTVIFRIGISSTPGVIARLGKVLEEAAEALESGAVVIVGRAGLRVRRLRPTGKVR